MTTRRSFVQLLTASVIAVSTEIPMLNRRQVEPVRPPDVLALSVCQKCGYRADSLTVRRNGVYLQDGEFVERTERAARLTEIVLRSEVSNLIDAGMCPGCKAYRKHFEPTHFVAAPPTPKNRIQ